MFWYEHKYISEFSIISLWCTFKSTNYRVESIPKLPRRTSFRRFFFRPTHQGKKRSTVAGTCWKSKTIKTWGYKIIMINRLLQLQNKQQKHVCWNFTVNTKTLKRLTSYSLLYFCNDFWSLHFRVSFTRLIHARLWCMCRCFFTSDGERCIQTFSKYCAIGKYGILKKTNNCNIAKQEGKKIQNRKIYFESSSCRFSTHKRRDFVSRGNFSTHASPNISDSSATQLIKWYY